jgi:hypothetical protein
VRPNPTLPFTNDGMKKILKTAVNSRVNAFILVMRYSGLRISDTATLAVDALKGNRLQLSQTKTGEPVSVLLPSDVAQALRDLPHTNPKYFFWTGSSRVTSLTGFWRAQLAEVFTKAKIENGHSHRFRDTFAVNLLQAGVSIENVSTLLGHQDIRITQKHYSPRPRAYSRKRRLVAGTKQEQLISDITAIRINIDEKLAEACGSRNHSESSNRPCLCALRTPTSPQSLLNITVLVAVGIEFAVNLTSPACSDALLPTQHPKTPTEGRVLWPKCGRFPWTGQMIALQRRLLT